MAPVIKALDSGEPAPLEFDWHNGYLPVLDALSAMQAAAVKPPAAWISWIAAGPTPQGIAEMVLAIPRKVKPKVAVGISG